ncbi:hypothetical protein M758_UG093600 [Ceratodon purpureus]|nr:hypothetical protein M758_UG093600 [Ceratodon purpureus]
MRRNWETPVAKMRSEKMPETRKKVTNNPRVGRQGYAGKAEKLVRLLPYLVIHICNTILDFVLFVCIDILRKRKERERSPTVTDVATEIKTSKENPSSSVISSKGHSRQLCNLLYSDF